MSIKATTVTYWITTVIFAGMMLFQAVMIFTVEQMQAAFTHLGYPSYFRVELATFAILGAAALLLPQVPRRLNEWAYAGFFITLISAFIAHISSGDGPDKFMAPVIFGAILVASYLTRKEHVSK